MTEIYIITGGKKENSTKRLNFDGVSPFQCTLKTPTSIERPVITITTFIPGARYAWIPAFNRYYFIEDVVCAHNQSFVYYLSIDVLGTYREDIRLLTLYAIRSNAGSALLPDPMYTHNNTINNTRTVGVWDGLEPAFSTQSGFFALETVSGGSSSSGGSTTLYLVAPSVMSQLMSEMFNPSSSIYGDEFTDDVVKTYFNPFQYIVGCKWFPFSFGGSVEDIRFGFWTSSYHGIKVTADSGFSKNFTIAVPKTNGNDYTSFSGSWVNHLLYVPMFGYFPLDPKYSGRSLTGHITIDFYTGNANLELRDGNAVIQSITGQAGISVNLSQLAVDTSNIGTTIFGSIENVIPGVISDTFSGDGIKSVIANTLGIATGFITKIPGLDGSGLKETMSPALTMCGANGNRTLIKDSYNIVLSSSYFSPDNAVAVHDMFNYPDDQERLLDNLTGYAIFKTDAVGIGNAAESAAILAYLNGGVYLE